MATTTPELSSILDFDWEEEPPSEHSTGGNAQIPAPMNQAEFDAACRAAKVFSDMGGYD